MFSWFGLALLTLAHAYYLPVTHDSFVTSPPPTDLPVTHDSFVTSPPPTDLPVTDDSFVTSPPPTDHDMHWMHGNGNYNPYGFTCPEGWTMHSTQCLLFVPQKMTWVEAMENCWSKGHGFLAAVYDSPQADEIHQEMENAGLHEGQVWVGGSKASGDSSWSWDYSIFDGFAEFCSGEPADTENCLEITFDGKSSGCLDAQRCDMQLPSVCGILLY